MPQAPATIRLPTPWARRWGVEGRMYCTHCGHQNQETANFCANCGRPLDRDGTTGALQSDDLAEDAADEARIDPAAIVAELDAGTALLVAVRGPNVGARFLLDRDIVTAGRHPDSDIFLDDITVSRRHAEFRRDGQMFWIHDMGSLNGTYVNGQQTDDRRLETGDEVQIGKFKLVVFVAEPSA